MSDVDGSLPSVRACCRGIDPGADAVGSAASDPEEDPGAELACSGHMKLRLFGLFSSLFFLKFFSAAS